MNEVICINESFSDWETTERYDVIIMNPPFIKLGEPFILKCASLLKDGGYLGCVMSPTWRSVVGEKGQHKKAYNILRQSGGFHMIHMYSAKDTADLFNQNIGQVDTFVWQKGVKINNTKVINQRGEEYTYNLDNHPQSPPVLPPYIYNQYFDQMNGLKWYRFTHPRDKQYGPSNNTFTDTITGKEFVCNDTNIEKTKGKKVIIDQSLKAYHVDNVGDVVVNDRYMFFFDTDDERDAIVKSLAFIIENNMHDLFVNNVGRMKHAFIPGIKR